MANSILDFAKDIGIKVVRFASKSSPLLAGWINKIVINRSVNVCRHRPHPWSTVHKYVSWTSLSDRNFSARHLPEKILTPPKNDNLENFFKRENQILSPKSTCLFPAFAQYLTDGFIRTKMPPEGDKGDELDPIRKQNNSNHQIDLSPLYGRTPGQTAILRLSSNESGKKGRLRSQMIGDEEYALFLYEGDRVKEEFKDLDAPLMSEKFKPFPGITSKLFAFGGDRANAAPQVAMMNTLFLREHNRLASIIEEKNPVWDDEQVFQTARNITIVLFIKIVVEEYINHIAPLNIFMADPSVAWNAPWNKPNWITTEFSLLYRWHPLIPDLMTWGGEEYPTGVDKNTLPIDQTIMNNNLLLDGGLKNAFIDMSAQPAGRLGAFNTAAGLIPFEIKAIKQGRLVKLASYNDYREYVSLKKRRRFSDVSSNQEVVDFLKKAYESVDDIEFYIGLFAEDTEKNSPLPELLGKMVAVDAFSQALTNPLLSEHVWKEETFTKEGWKTINETRSLGEILDRNVKGGLNGGAFVGMTQPSWKPN